jgi:hypothetical protein
LFKKLSKFKVAAFVMFFVLCVPFIAYGENITNNIQGNSISENEVVETNTAESPESSNPTEPCNSNETNDPGVTDEESLEIAIDNIDEQEESILDESDIIDSIENEGVIEEPDVEPDMEEPNIEEPEKDIEKPAEEPIEEMPAKEEKKLDEELKVLPPIQTAEQIILTSVEGLSPEAIVEFTLNGTRIGLVSNGVITDAVPILAADKSRVKASVVNKVRIVGAKINFDTYLLPDSALNENSIVTPATPETNEPKSETEQSICVPENNKQPTNIPESTEPVDEQPSPKSIETNDINTEQNESGNDNTVDTFSLQQISENSVK